MDKRTNQIHTSSKLTRSFCGASLLSANRLVTAAHCWYDGHKQASQFEVVLGAQYMHNGGVRINTSVVFTHPQWYPYDLTNDIAIIYLPVNVLFATSIQPVSLPMDQLHESFVGEQAVAAGYGITKSDEPGVPYHATVSQVFIQIIPLSKCENFFDPGLVKPTNLCTVGVNGGGTCQGDSGGPLVIKRPGRNILIGITSFGIGRPALCDASPFSVFTKVTSFYNFIVQHMK